MITAKILTPGADLADAHAIRTAVFVEEQGFCARQEFDDIDKVAYHVVLYDGDQPIATGRVFHKEGGLYGAGRIAVLKAYRKGGVGRQVMERLEQQVAKLGGDTVTLGAQLQAMPFYQRIGYQAYGAQYMDEHCPHQHMKKSV